MFARIAVGWVVVVLFALGLVGGALAGDAHGPAPAGRGGVASDPAAASQAAGRLQAARESEARAKRRREERASPEAWRERELSRTRFGGMSAREARELARERFAQHVTAKAFRPLRGRKLVRVDGPNSATVEVDGKRGKLLASGPLAVRGGDGEIVPLDLSF